MFRFVFCLPRNILKLLVRCYQRCISPFFPPRCKYYPSCSTYAVKALEIHGFWKGSILAAWRILRCNPLSDGGVDYPPLPGRWDNPWTSPGSVNDSTYETATRAHGKQKEDHLCGKR